jgi:Ca2+-binding EF-hand superfamily protein
VKDLNFIEAFNSIDKQRKGFITKQDLLKFLNKFVINAKFTIEDICNVYRRLKIDAGDDSDTLSYVNFMNAILPPA